MGGDGATGARGDGGVAASRARRVEPHRSLSWVHLPGRSPPSVSATARPPRLRRARWTARPLARRSHPARTAVRMAPRRAARAARANRPRRPRERNFGHGSSRASSFAAGSSPAAGGRAGESWRELTWWWRERGERGGHGALRRGERQRVGERAELAREDVPRRLSGSRSSSSSPSPPSPADSCPPSRPASPRAAAAGAPSRRSPRTATHSCRPARLRASPPAASPRAAPPAPAPHAARVSPPPSPRPDRSR